MSTVLLAECIRLAANIRESSYDRAGADKALEEARPNVPESMVHLLDFNSFYLITLQEACIQAEQAHHGHKGFGQVAFMLLKDNWNEALDWANEILNQDASAPLGG